MWRSCFGSPTITARCARCRTGKADAMSHCVASSITPTLEDVPSARQDSMNVREADQPNWECADYVPETELPKILFLLGPGSRP